MGRRRGNNKASAAAGTPQPTYVSTGFAQAGPPPEPIVYHTGFAQLVDDPPSPPRAAPSSSTSKAAPSASRTAAEPALEDKFAHIQLDPVSRRAFDPTLEQSRQSSARAQSSSAGTPQFAPSASPATQTTVASPPPPRHIPHSSLPLGLDPSTLVGKAITRLSTSDDHPFLELHVLSSPPSAYKLYFENYFRLLESCVDGADVQLQYDEWMSKLVRSLDPEKEEWDSEDGGGPPVRAPVLIEDCSYAIRTHEETLGFRRLTRTTEHHALGIKYNGRWGYVWGRLRKKCQPPWSWDLWPVYIVRLNQDGEVVEGELGDEVWAPDY